MAHVRVTYGTFIFYLLHIYISLESETLDYLKWFNSGISSEPEFDRPEISGKVDVLCISLPRKCGGDIFDILAQSGKYLHSTTFIHPVTQFSFSLLNHSLNTTTLCRTRASENQSSCHIMSAFWGYYRRKKCFRPLGLELLGSRYSRTREMPAEVSYCH